MARITRGRAGGEPAGGGVRRTGEELTGGMNDAGNALTSSSGMGETISRKDRNPEETSCTAQAP